jgi:hypothetical protein
MHHLLSVFYSKFACKVFLKFIKEVTVYIALALEYTKRYSWEAALCHFP